MGVASKLWVSAMDGPGVTNTERRTLEYLLAKYDPLPGARKILEEKLAANSNTLLPKDTQRLIMLKEIFKAMDKDGNGSVDLGEYLAATSNPTMLKLFTYMDGKG